MSFWTHVFGTIYVEPIGYSEHARDFVLHTVLDHLPPVTGSERDVYVDVIKDPLIRFSSSSDEFGQEPREDGRHEMFDQSVGYFLVLHGSLRDRMFDKTVSEFDEWLKTLARRVRIKEILVRVSDDMEQSRQYADAGEYYDMFEEPSYEREGFATMTAIRRCPNWRYDFMPDLSGVGNWCETLPYLVPGGAEMMRELDEIGGQIPAEELDEEDDG